MTSSALEGYVSACRALSLTARLGIALRSLEDLLERRGLDHPELEEFFDYLWDFPILDAESFRSWGSRQPDLVGFALGDPLPDDLREAICSAGLDEKQFRSLLEFAAEIIYSSLYGATLDDFSLDCLRRTLALATSLGAAFPDPSVFRQSSFSQRSGWGDPIDPASRDRWRARR